MDRGLVDGPFTVVIRAPNQKYNDQTINCYQNWTVEKLKAHLSDVYPSRPSSKDQRLVYSGKLLLDHFTLKDVFRKHDEYHMLHLVCTSRTPPSSPKPPEKCRNKLQETSALPTAPQSSDSLSPGPDGLLSPAESSDGLRQQAAAVSYPHMHPGFTYRALWEQYSRQPAPPTNTAAYYSTMTLMWWQQLYVWQYYLHCQLLAASSQHLPAVRPTAQLHQTATLNQQPQEDHHANPEVHVNAHGGEILGEDWPEWVYIISRAVISLSIFYFYSSFSRVVMVMIAMLVLYPHQAGWFPFNFDDVQLPGDRANQDDVDEDLQNNDVAEMDDVTDDSSDDDGDSGEDEAEDPYVDPLGDLLSTTWSFITTFFMSLIPEGPPHAAN
ncbi:homocysteine-responsive endoplasmic reticulum-resident ubiquitin-like domain member 2 protein [Thalassophryne amazonica]|uniref:homocysteine-responsive endoplasmic reticulum-resident ubiquitin-like domain member 2 protein n=1 Tax=Thalassophryne amazonica TaxID=390379 RepID=UPI0014713FDD|nr:homocysteine-responsive endoplasmic reticulum-resident ubiquitin-like domain member 2 protein [Thalassophryne amazonica]XP_034016909.1 homocysteine-responsive endoplasmic reticulum-resident ubiquitin-like domain member 2 protein [Thalassophryne amazonica]